MPKNDTNYSSILDKVHKGCPSQEIIDILQKRVISVSAAKEFNQLSKSGSLPVCLFPTFIFREEHNKEMLKH